MSDELSSSELGTLNYWEDFYANELTNFEDHGDVGEIWFGQQNARSIIRYINEKLEVKKDDKILDLGCGNGWTLVELSKIGFTNLLGVDYAAKAVSLARKVLQENNLNVANVNVEVCDILDGDLTSMMGGFKLVHDKGTYDAISLNPEDSKQQRTKYINNVRDLLVPGFEVKDTMETRQMSFGGKVGHTVTNIIFQKT